ncbi:MAG TPA: prolyl oligopeptidase family serine peptidase, partial [Gemmatimonadaceae bacterium]|nr:prolyl oligopeptidase family serine peptidase [Gemmatimonadaceae bacterium]
PFGASLSPGGKYVVYFRDGRWFAHPTAEPAQRVDLTARLSGVRFEQETWDRPSVPASWGVAGWTPGDGGLLLNTRYDLWEVDPSGKRPARVVTDSVGTRLGLSFRLVDFDRDDPYVDPAAPQLFRVLDTRTKASGFWRDYVRGDVPPERIVMGDERYGTPSRARNADSYLVTRESFTRFPDLWAGTRLDSLTRLTDANPQQRDYSWGSAQLVSWLSDDGVPLQGLLFLPAEYESSRKYPLLVYFYEQYSDDLHQYRAPSGRNTINPTVYTSLGYAVFIPDIAYTTGYPGPSALKSVVPGVQSLIARGVVDPDAVGIAGQSWGGYQAAYIITQTTLFRAAFAGAPVANMTSAYGGIRWESGVARAFQYEHDQSRIGGSIWQYPTRFIENSPLFYADRVRTPLFIMSNDNDGAVPWQEGIQLFVALRRLGREVYLIDYNGDGHNPRKRANQKDVDMRMQQFFAHHLLGAPAPDWMRRGVPFLRKGSDQAGLAPGAVPEP